MANSFYNGWRFEDVWLDQVAGVSQGGRSGSQDKGRLMSGVAGRSGRKTFVPSPEQRNNVKILAGRGIPQEQICLLVINPQTGKPLDEKSLRKHFNREITTGKIELHARISNFILASIFGVTPPAGTVAIDNQHVRGMLAMFFAKTRMGWKETVVNRVNDHPQVPTGIEDPNAARQRNIDLIEQISDHLKTVEPSRR